MASELKRYVIDACGLIAFLRGEKGSNQLADDLKSGHEFYLHSVKLGEIYYDSIRVGGTDYANALVEDVFNWTGSIYSAK